jgi:excisionase family DNA binding protein
MNNMNNPTAVLTVPEVAKILKIGRSSAYVLAKSGCFPCLKFGNSMRIPYEPFFNWLNNINNYQEVYNVRESYQ